MTSAPGQRIFLDIILIVEYHLYTHNEDIKDIV